MVFMDKRCGCWQVGDDVNQGAIEFRLFFPAGVDPQFSAIRVAGNFQHLLDGQDWDFQGGLQLSMESRDDQLGTYWSAKTPAPLPAGFYEYKYHVEFDGLPSRIVTDPCARYSGLSNQNSGIVVGGSRPEENRIRPLAGGRLPLTGLNMYELMIDDFTLEYRKARAPLDAVRDRLDGLRDLGVNAVEFMPWTAWKHLDFDWGYEPLQFFAVESRYANDLNHPQEKLSWLKVLISECHDHGIHVIMDGVYNHVSYDFPYPQFYRDTRACPFTAETFGDAFPGLQDLDFGNPITGKFIFEVCQYWIDVFGIDGIRYDNTVNYHVPGDMRGLPKLLTRVAKHVKDKGERSFSQILEHIDASAAKVTNETAADSFWDNSLYEQTFDALWNDRITPALLHALNNRRYLTAGGKVPTLYLSNHDHSHVAWQSGARENLGAAGRWWKVQPFLIALFTSTATPLIRNGDELGEEYFIPEDDHGTGRRVTGRPLRWKLGKDKIGITLTALHRRLATIRHDHPALRSPFIYPGEWETWRTGFNEVGVGVDVARQLIIYHRWAQVPQGMENIVVILNFSNTDQVVDAPFPFHGRWTDLLASFAGGQGWAVDVAGPTAPIPVGSHWGRVLQSLTP